MYQIFLAFFLFSCFYFLRHAQSCVHKDKNGSSSIWLNKTDHLHKAVFLVSRKGGEVLFEVSSYCLLCSLEN